MLPTIYKRYQIMLKYRFELHKKSHEICIAEELPNDI